MKGMSCLTVKVYLASLRAPLFGSLRAPSFGRPLGILWRTLRAPLYGRRFLGAGLQAPFSGAVFGSLGIDAGGMRVHP